MRNQVILQPEDETPHLNFIRVRKVLKWILMHLMFAKQLLHHETRIIAGRIDFFFKYIRISDF